jgi:hypothetical protein
MIGHVEISGLRSLRVQQLSTFRFGPPRTPIKAPSPHWRLLLGSFLNQLLIALMYSAVGHSGRECWLTASARRACAPMALDPEEIVTLLLLAALAIAWNWRLGH